MRKKCLLIRFSSFGDIVQAMGVLPLLKKKGFEVHWLTKTDFADVVSLSPHVDKVWALEKRQGLLGLIRWALFLRSQGYTHLYDAHRSLRSWICLFVMGLPFFERRDVCVRSKERVKRFKLFYLRKNTFPRPFRAMESYRFPLKKWGVGTGPLPLQLWNFDKILTEERRKALMPYQGRILLIPSAAWKMKTWPIEFWKELLRQWALGPPVILGGPQDHVCKDLEEMFPGKVVNLAGKLSLVESCFLISQGRLAVSADTGLLHVGDLLGTPGILLLGPTAFGYPTHSQIKVLEAPLSCRPCTKDGRGQCSQKIYQKCMVELTPRLVWEEIQKQLSDQKV